MADPPPAASPPGPSLGTLISLATGFLALVGGIAYAIMRYSYQEYYNVFGLTPDDVGPGSAAALTQSGAGVATFVALFAILPITLAILGALAVERALRRTRRPHHTVWYAVVRLALPAVAALGIYRAFTALTSGHWEAKQLVVLAVGVVLLTAKWDADDAASRNMSPMFPAARRLPPWRWIVAALMTVVGALVLGGSLPQDARATARCAIARNLPVRFVHTHRTLPLLDHISVLRVRADPATLRWIDPGAAVALPTGRVVYLGEAGDRYFVFSPGRTLEVPAGSVVLTTIPHARHCHYWESGQPLEETR